MTSYADAVALMGRNPHAEITYRINSQLEWHMDKFDGGRITTKGGIVNSIRLELNSNEVLPLVRLSQLYGAPSEMRVNSCEDAYCDVDLTYPNHRMVLELLLRHGAPPYKVEIADSSSVERIKFFSDMDTYRELEPYGEPSTFFTWNGYGLYP